MLNVRFNSNMDNFRFNFPSRGQLESASLDWVFLTVSKILPYYDVFFDNFILAIITRMLSVNHLNLLLLKI